MENDINFEIYLFISPKKIAICVYQKSDFKEIFKKEIVVDNFLDDSEFRTLISFLDENIIKIEVNGFRSYCTRCSTFRVRRQWNFLKFCSYTCIISNN